MPLMLTASGPQDVLIRASRQATQVAQIPVGIAPVAIETGVSAEDLEAGLQTKEDSGVAASLLASHVNADDPHGDRAYTDQVISELPPAGLPDEAWTEVEAPISDVFTGGMPAFLGTDGFSIIRWVRLGRIVFARWYWAWMPDGDQIGLPAVFLPAIGMPLPKMAPPGFAVPGGFGYAQAPAPTGFLMSVPPAITDLLGTGEPENASLIMVTQTELNPTGLESLFSSTNPVEWGDRIITYQGAIEYEALEAAS